MTALGNAAAMGCGPTEPTEAPFVGSVGADPGHTENIRARRYHFNGIDLGRPGALHALHACGYFINGELDLASAFMKAAVATGNCDALEMHATLLYRQGNLAAAADWAEAALRAGSGSLAFIAFTAHLHAERGNLEVAFARFAEYESLITLRPSFPQWRGEPIAGRSLYVPRAIGGFGDEIMWARFCSQVAGMGAAVTMDCSPPLVELFKSLHGVSIGVSDRADFYCPLLSLPSAIGVTRETIPASPYLSASNPLRLAEDGRLRVGLSWGCGPMGPQTRYCALSELAPLGEVQGVQLYSLDKNQQAEQLNPPPTGMDVIDLGSSLKGFADTANAVASMDLVISTDNVIANLAGALGKPLIVLLPYAGEFRWGRGGKSDWYPTARVFRQARPGNWREVVAEVVPAIRPLTAAKAMGMQPCLG